MAAFMKLGDIKGEFQADELTGTFNALNETTNVRPSKGESISIVHPAFKTGYDPGPIGSPVALNSLDVGPVNKTADKGWWTVDLRSDNRFVIERFEPAAGMDSFGESLNPIAELGSTSGPGGSTFMTGQFEMPNGSARHRLTVDVWY
jgi:hypothetical protein